MTSFRYLSNYHKSSAIRYSKGQSGIAEEHLYAHLFSAGHEGINDMRVKMTDKMDVKEPARREVLGL